MVWNIYWGLAFGFILSSLVRAFISTDTISSRLGINSVTSVLMSSFFGAISSSCSYAAASMSRTLLVKGATWSNAVVFMVASTNLVFEIFIVIVTLLGWPFLEGELAGGAIFIFLSALLIAWAFPRAVKDAAREKAKQEWIGAESDGHAYHTSKNNSHTEKGFLTKMKAASGYFYMDVMMVGKDIFIGVSIASVVMAVVPMTFWKTLFLSDNTDLPYGLVVAWNALTGILIAILAFVCSVGNIVMAAVLWHGGISFGGVIAFILADLVTVPMLMVYRKYYGARAMWFLLILLAVCIFVTAIAVDLGFSALHWIPRHVATPMISDNSGFMWDWQAWLNVIFIPLSLFYFFTGRKSMIKR